MPYLPALFFAGGFVFDLMTLGRIDNIMNILSHGLFLLLTMGALIAQILEVKAGENAKRFVVLIFTYQHDIIHFMLGALLNAFVIFYFKSGSLINTFLLVAVLSILLIVNEIEFFKQRGVTLKVVLFTISLSSFFIYLLPVLIGKTNSGIFMASQVCTLLVILVLWQLLLKFEVDFSRIKNNLLVPATSVILIFTLLYGARIIPPVPLSLKQIGIYHNIEKNPTGFVLSRQTPSWKIWARGDQDFEARAGDKIYLFSRIFAPGGFKDKLYFHFQLKDRQGKWRTTDKIPLTIVGGREEGFRGYAYKQNYQDGIWRALVETAEGLEIGRIGFTVTSSADDSPRTWYKEVY
ncbi:MAG: DUF2914 domain-containing protein [Proteobacteria bacterium]|nr:DUF2914 domain-containing protein [Pseudomonadota bacterium]MBU1738650.1 DUF2914 domain-containing protein [Pseudomonadota bacterium]